ncbi:energy transducer TonB [Parabacteroides faecis]|uniref:energy transducer TonB n=1 Tax=Parabacteroides faecis TaxID=1217282 RepID=UPI002164C24A|nr:energy transducer TonB [Parabacteroides faecis]MCS2894146.1 energy transducer TonB [Parabacteroides faecis]UVQ47268.1 energy transducer TonB [Parabacteroides faecis]
MENYYLSLVYLCCAWLVSSCNVSTSRKQTDLMTKDSICETPAHNMSSKKVPAQEVPMRLLEKLAELYGDEPPGFTGFSVTNKNCPDFICGVYVNESNRLVVQIKGDSIVARKRLEDVLDSKDFLIETDAIYTQKELIALKEQLLDRQIILGDLPLLRNVSYTKVRTYDIEICLIVNTPEEQKKFREQVMDSPAFCFTGPEIPDGNTVVGVSDTMGIVLRPEYPVYSAATKEIRFILYNSSRHMVHCDRYYFITSEDEEGVWHQLSGNYYAFLDVANGVGSGEYTEFSVGLNLDMHKNRAGRYRFFFHVIPGDVGFATKVLMMAEFRLSDDKEELNRITKNPMPESFLGGLSEQEFRKQEKHMLETTVFTVVEQMPEFSEGGQKALLAFIADNIPENITGEGRATVSFTVEKDGSLSDIRVVRSSSYKELDDEAIRIIRKMPKWIPGKHRGKTVRVKYTIPVTFRKKQESNNQ